MLQDLSVLDEVKICPHCRQQMSCCNAPPIHVGDGLGWGAEVLFVCLNDDCPLFVNGWEKIEQQYGHRSSYRYMELAGSSESNVMMVGTSDAYKGFVIDREAILAQNKRFQQEKEAVKQLETCVAENNITPILTLLCDEAANIDDRKTAVECMLAIGSIDVIDPLRNHKFRNTGIEQAVNIAIRQILEKNFKKECPHCMEIIKAQAKKCMHCKEEL